MEPHESQSRGSNSKVGNSSSPILCLNDMSSFRQNMSAKIGEGVKNVIKIGRDDPRRIFHSFKVGLALTLVSTFYYVTPLYHSFGESAMWAVLTVVVVMEYTVGGTLCKGLNRAIATLLAGALGIGAHQLAVLCGNKGEPIFLALTVFILGGAATFSRFMPEIKARYDYGVTIFILTFSLVAVSSYRVDELVQLAHQRLTTIAIGVAICLATSIFVFPVWAGEDLHSLLANNLDKLASFLEGLGAECFGDKGDLLIEILENKSFLQVYKGVLNSKPMEDSLSNFARWEPVHGPFSFRYPWKYYQKIGALCRKCAASMDALTSYITTPTSKIIIQDPSNPTHMNKIQSICHQICSESAMALKDLSKSTRTMNIPSSSANCHVSTAMEATLKLKSALSNDVALSEILNVAIKGSILVELAVRTEEISKLVHELARDAHFKNLDPVQKSSVKPLDEASPNSITIDVDK